MIRAYKPEDLPMIMDMANRAWQPIYTMFRNVYGEDLFNLITPDAAVAKGRQIESHCQNHPEWVYICEEDGKIVGFVTFLLDTDKGIGQIGNNAVDPDCPLKGIGQQMYKTTLDYFRRNKMRYASVFTGLDEAHARARRAYERAGFSIRHDDTVYFMKL